MPQAASITKILKQLKHSISQLNELSAGILSELGNDAPSLEAIRKGMSEREEHLKVLSIIQNNKKEMNLSTEDVQILRPLFDAFITMNDEIQQRISTLMNTQLDKMAVATKQRKVQESYGISKTPNISYF